MREAELEPRLTTRQAAVVRAAVLGLFFVSGISGLIDQVVWVRHVSLAFGSTVQSASLVTSVFLGGLGLGALAAGRWVDGRGENAALRAYALCEFAIAGLGVALAFVLPWLAAGGGWSGGYAVADSGWHVIGWTTVVWRVLVVAGLIGPSALCMGATLTLLIRAVVDVRDAGWWVGWLYGLNTLGAAAGALSTDLWLVPSLGLRGTLFAAAGLNLVAALGAALLPLATRDGRGSPARPAAMYLPGPVSVSLFLAGFAAMGMELAWFRFLGGALGPYRAVFSVLVTVLLVGLFLGSVGAGSLERRFGGAAWWFAASQIAFAGVALFAFASFDPEALVHRHIALIPTLADADSGQARWLLHRVNLATVAGLVLWPAIAMGASFPLANALVQRSEATLGSRAGWLYLATTAGNVAGALVVGFVWLPGMGIQATVLVLATLAVLAPLPLGRPGGVGLVGLIAVVAFARLPSDQLLWSTFPANRVEQEGVLAIHEGVEQILVITGRPEGPARLWTGGHPMTSTSAHAQRYMRLMAHVPLLMQDEPERVAVICFGVGNTLSAAALHPSVTELHAIDLSSDILSHGHFFEHANQGVLNDPRLEVFVNDGRHHLRSYDTRYDLITLEPPPIGHAGVSALYSLEFYESARARLREGGVISQWLPAYQVSEATVRQMVAAFQQVFPDSALLVVSGRELVLVGSMGPRFSLAEVDRRISERPEVADDLAAVGAPDAVELAAMFGGALSEQDAPPLVDDRPLLEYSQVSHVMETALPPELFQVETLPDWCADCGQSPALSARLDLTQQLYRTDAFLHFSNLVSPGRTASFDWSGEGDSVDVVADSPTLLRLLHGPDSLLERAMVHREAGRLEQASQVLEAAAWQAPGDARIDDLRESWAR